ncbi:hypothetical protein BGZ58_007551 [Dissophora ornata]|nr:hypothetical protein BGZ58_007551 [Dissophora ornata]
MQEAEAAYSPLVDTDAAGSVQSIPKTYEQEPQSTIDPWADLEKASTTLGGDELHLKPQKSLGPNPLPREILLQKLWMTATKTDTTGTSW